MPLSSRGHSPPQREATLSAVSFCIFFPPSIRQNCSFLTGVLPTQPCCHLASVTPAPERLNCTNVRMFYCHSDVCCWHTWYPPSRNLASAGGNTSWLILGGTPTDPHTLPGPCTSQTTSGQTCSEDDPRPTTLQSFRGSRLHFVISAADFLTLQRTLLFSSRLKNKKQKTQPPKTLAGYNQTNNKRQ